MEMESQPAKLGAGSGSDAQAAARPVRGGSAETAGSSSTRAHQATSPHAGDAGAPGDLQTELALGLRLLLGESLDTKPRPFENVRGIGGGGGSCFINATLQVLFASETVQRTLAGIVALTRASWRGACDGLAARM